MSSLVRDSWTKRGHSIHDSYRTYGNRLVSKVGIRMKLFKRIWDAWGMFVLCFVTIYVLCMGIAHLGRLMFG